AAYPAQALDCTMSALPRPGGYDDSPAFAALGRFDGTLLIVAGTNDAVVSPDVVARYATSAPAAKTNVIQLEECGHAIHAWLADHDRDRALVLNGIAAAISGRPSPLPVDWLSMRAVVLIYEVLYYPADPHFRKRTVPEKRIEAEFFVCDALRSI